MDATAPPSLRALISEDLRADRRTQPQAGSGLRGLAMTLARFAFSPRLQAVALVRLAQAADRRSPLLASIVKYVNHVLTGCDVAARAEIAPGLLLFHPVGVVIGPNVRIGPRCTVMQGVTVGHGPGGSPTIAEDVFIGPGAKVYGAITIGPRARIGANAVLTVSVPADGFAAGVPARVLKIGDERV